MKLVRILQSQAIRFLKLTGREGGEVYGLNIAKACEERYGFLQGPHVLADFDLTRGVTFLHGYFRDRTVISRFQLYSNGLLAEAGADTKECDDFLDDIIEWATKLGAVETHKIDGVQRAYFSQIEVESPTSIALALRRFAEVGLETTKCLRTYGDQTAVIEPTAIAFSSDATPPKPAQFKFERREGIPFASDIYFASAPLRTDHHLSVLEKLESVLTTLAS